MASEQYRLAVEALKQKGDAANKALSELTVLMQNDQLDESSRQLILTGLDKGILYNSNYSGSDNHIYLSTCLQYYDDVRSGRQSEYSSSRDISASLTLGHLEKLGKKNHGFALNLLAEIAHSNGDDKKYEKYNKLAREQNNPLANFNHAIRIDNFESFALLGKAYAWLPASAQQVIDTRIADLETTLPYRRDNEIESRQKKAFDINEYRKLANYYQARANNPEYEAAGERHKFHGLNIKGQEFHHIRDNLGLDANHTEFKNTDRAIKESTQGMSQDEQKALIEYGNRMITSQIEMLNTKVETNYEEQPFDKLLDHLIELLNMKEKLVGVIEINQAIKKKNEHPYPDRDAQLKQQKVKANNALSDVGNEIDKLKAEVHRRWSAVYDLQSKAHMEYGTRGDTGYTFFEGAKQSHPFTELCNAINSKLFDHSNIDPKTQIECMMDLKQWLKEAASKPQSPAAKQLLKDVSDIMETGHQLDAKYKSTASPRHN